MDSKIGSYEFRANLYKSQGILAFCIFLGGLWLMDYSDTHRVKYFLEALDLKYMFTYYAPRPAERSEAGRGAFLF